MDLYSLARSTSRSLTFFLIILTVFVLRTDFAQADPPQKTGPKTASASGAVSLNLADFHPVADGVTDDGPVFQLAINALAQAGGGTLLVPAGKYFIGTPVIKDFSGVNGPIIIQGVPSTKMPAPPSSEGEGLAAGLALTTDVTPATGNDASAFTFKNAKQLLIEHISFSGRPSQETDAFATIALENIDDATIRHCEFYGISSMGGGNVVRSTHSSLSIELSVFLGCTANSGGYAPTVENVDWLKFSISNSIFLDYGTRPFFGKTGLGSPYSWINVAKAADPTPDSPRREVIVRDLFLDEGGYIGLTATPHRWGNTLPIDLVYITGLKMNVSNFLTSGNSLYDVRDILIENSHYGYSQNASAAIDIYRANHAIYDKLTLVADATRLHADDLTQRLTVINSPYETLDSLAKTTTVLETTPEDDPVQFVRKQYSDVLGKAPDPAAHFYWSDLLIRCEQDNECLNHVRANLTQYLASNPETTFTLTGTLLDEHDEVISGGTVNITGSFNFTVLSDSEGKFRFSNLPTSGSYTLAVSKSHYTFAPDTQTVLNPAGDQNVVFNGSWNRHKISGRIVTQDGQPLPGVTVKLDQATSSVTDEDGNYSFPGLLETNSYSVAPTLVDFAFTPATRSFEDLEADQTANFVAQSTLKHYTIYGRIVTDNALGVPGVTVKLGEATSVTNGGGYYAFTGLVERQTYSVAPVSNHFTFTPGSATFANLSSDRTADFFAKPILRTISGKIADAGGAPLSGITVRLGLGQSSTIVTTSANGSYEFKNLFSGQSYTVTAISSEFWFSPVSRTFDVLSANETADFVTKPPPKILTVEGTDVALALESVMFMAQPFSLGNEYGFSIDHATRVMVFLSNLEINDATQLSAVVENQSGTSYPVTIENLDYVPGLSWLKQLNLKLPHNITSGNELKLKISTVQGSINSVRLRVVPE
jgi:hypothetical protein